MGAKPVSKSKKVLVGMSGGVDSSVAAALLRKQGYEVEGAYMQCWSSGPYCSTEVDRADALRVASQLDIPFQVFDFEKEYKEKVLDYFFSEYEAGRTPNPDVACNREVKFGLFLKKALEMGFDYVATGHYARVDFDETRKEFKLLKGVDPSKDQSYFLYTLGQKQLSHTLFPIGVYTKKEIREIAESLGLVVANKKDSQGICFIGPVDVGDFLRQNLERKEGNLIDPEGNVVGKHDGLAFYTIGQREGLRINSTLPYYVYSKNQAKNEILVAPVGSEKLFLKQALIKDPSWVRPITNSLDCQVSLRYHQKPQDCRLSVSEKGVWVDFKEAQRAVTPGQAAVFFVGDELLGGGTVEELNVVP